jgi:hypothetical protein
VEHSAVGSGWPAGIAGTLARASATIMRELMEDKVFSLCVEWCRSSCQMRPECCADEMQRSDLLKASASKDSLVSPLHTVGVRLRAIRCCLPGNASCRFACMTIYSK